MESRQLAPSMPIGEGVRNFISAAKSLLSSEMCQPELTAQECELVAAYVTILSHTKYPWSKALPVRVYVNGAP